MATRKPAPKPAPKPTPKPAPKPTPKPAPKPVEKNLKGRPTLTPTPKPAPLDLVRNPNFDSAMAQRNYANLMRDQQARIGAEGGAPSADPTAQPYVFDKSKQRAGKEIILSFAGGQYGSVNDEAADAIAKKYNLDIVNKPNPNKDEGPKIYRFSVKGDVDKGLSGIKNEPGVRYAEPNFRSFIPERGPDPFVTYEDNRMRAALNGEELPTPPAGYVEGFDKSKNLTPPAEIGGDFRAPQRPPQGPQEGGGIGEYMPVDPNRNAPTLMPIPNIPQGPQQPGFGDIARQLPQQRPFNPNASIPLPGFERQEAQQMQDYQNFLKQGMQRSDTLNQGAMAGFANMQPGMQVPQPGMQVPQPGTQVPQAGIGQTQRPNMAGMGPQQRRQNPAQRKFSTFSNKPARFF